MGIWKRMMDALSGREMDMEVTVTHVSNSFVAPQVSYTVGTDSSGVRTDGIPEAPSFYARIWQIEVTSSEGDVSQIEFRDRFGALSDFVDDDEENPTPPFTVGQVVHMKTTEFSWFGGRLRFTGVKRLIRP